MKLYTVSWQNRPLVCLESQPGWLTPLPYETMNHPVSYTHLSG